MTVEGSIWKFPLVAANGGGSNTDSAEKKKESLWACIPTFH